MLPAPEPTVLSAALATGFLLGFRHAMDPDHIAAVSTLSTTQRRYSAMFHLAVWWGVGHTVVLAACGVLVVLLKTSIPPSAEAAFEGLVGVMLIGLGWRLFRGSHGDSPPIRTGLQALFVGALHGLAGSAAVILLAAATIDSPLYLILFLVVFGGGSIIGMLLFTGLLGVPAYIYRESDRFSRWFTTVAACASIAIGAIILIASIRGLLNA